MSSKKNKQKDAELVKLEEMILSPSRAYPLDLDLTDRTNDVSRVTHLDISLVPDEVPVQEGKDLTLYTGKRHLKKILGYNDSNPHELQTKRIIHPDMGDQSILNSFREIRTHLIQKKPEKNFVLMVASLDHNMGATFTTVNIGAAFSYEGQKTALLIDCNQDKPKLDRFFDVEVKYGLSDYLHDTSIRSKNIIYPTGIYRTNFIPIGNRRNAGEEFLSSERMQQFIGILKRRHADRYLILNAPPLELSADAAILSEVADFIIIVIPYGRVTRSRISNAVKLLPKNKLAGIILNKSKNYVRF